MSNFKDFIRDLFASWWGRVFVILGAISTTATFVASFRPGFVVPRWMLLVVAIVCWIIAPFDLYKRLRAEITRLRAQNKAQLVIYDEGNSRYYVDVALAPGQPPQRRGVYAELHVMVENKGDRNAILKDFGLIVQETNWRQERIAPQARNYVQTRSAYKQLRQDFVLRYGSVTVPSHDFLKGIIPLELPVESIPAAEPQVLHCTLTLTDTEGNSGQREIEVQQG